MSLKMRRFLVRALIIANAFFIPQSLVYAQSKQKEQDEVIRLKSDLIELRVVVTDKSGRVIDTLKKEDFELIDDGRPQEINFFSLERILPASAPSTPGETVAREAAPAEAASSVTRTVVFFVDTIHLTASDMPMVKQSLRRFLSQQVSDQDMVALITSSGALGLLEQFTKDRRVTAMAVERLRALKVASDYEFSPALAAGVTREEVLDVIGEATTTAIKILGFREGPILDKPEVRARIRAKMILDRAAAQRKAALNTLKAVVERMAEMPGQRMIVMLSPGFSLQDHLGGFDTKELQFVTSRAVRSGVVIYTIDARGLQTLEGFDAAMPVDNGGYSEQKDKQNILNALAKDTGGEFYFNTNDLSRSVNKALEENQIYYTLGYYPTLDEGDKGFHRITVKVKGHPEYSVRTQRGYFPEAIAKQNEAEAARTPRERVLKAMSSPLPITSIGVAASADIVKAEAGDGLVSLRVFIDGRSLDYQERGDKHAFALELTTAVFDLRGKPVHGFNDTIDGALPGDKFELARKNGLSHLRNLTLKPGLYQVRVVLREPATERLGTAITWFEVPDFRKAKLVMTSIILAERHLNTKAESSEELFQPNVSEGIKVFKRDGLLVYGAMIYGSVGLAAGSALRMRVEVWRGEEKVYESGWRQVSARAAGNARAAAEVGGQLTLKTEPGLYELRLIVADASGKLTTQQSALFRLD